MSKAEIKNPALKSWDDLNAKLMKSDIEACKELIIEELSGRNREAFISRIQKRINKLETDQKKAEIDSWIKNQAP